MPAPRPSVADGAWVGLASTNITGEGATARGNFTVSVAPSRPICNVPNCSAERSSSLIRSSTRRWAKTCWFCWRTVSRTLRV